MRAAYARPTVSGRLQRDDKTWPLPMVEDIWHLRLIDELYAGDRLDFPDLQDGTLLVQVVFAQGQLFSARDRAEMSWRQRCGLYELTVMAACPHCEHHAAHTAVIPLLGGAAWHFDRICLSCDHQWPQTGSRPAIEKVEHLL